MEWRSALIRPGPLGRRRRNDACLQGNPQNSKFDVLGWKKVMYSLVGSTFCGVETGTDKGEDEKEGSPF